MAASSGHLSTHKHVSDAPLLAKCKTGIIPIRIHTLKELVRLPHLQGKTIAMRHEESAWHIDQSASRMEYTGFL